MNEKVFLRVDQVQDLIRCQVDDYWRQEDAEHLLAWLTNYLAARRVEVLRR